MGHRHLFNTSQPFESEQDHNWNHMPGEQPQTSFARSSPIESGSILHPVSNTPVQQPHFSFGWNPAPMSNGYVPVNHQDQGSQHQPSPPGPSYCPFLHPSTAGSFYAVPESYMHHTSSLNYNGQAFHGTGSNFVDPTMGNGKGIHKRKSPEIPGYERGSSSRYAVGNSSDLPLLSELEKEKHPQHMTSWECITMPPQGGGNISSKGEGSSRNVRSRPTFVSESDFARTHLSNNHSHNSHYSSHFIDRSTSMDFLGQGSNILMPEWSNMRVAPSHGRALMADNSGFGHETSHFLTGSSMSNPSGDMREYHHDVISTAVAAQNFHSSSSHSLNGVRISDSQRSKPTSRASSSSLQLGHGAPADERMRLAAESCYRQPRPLPAWRNGERSGRSRISHERYRSMSNDTSLHDRFSSEGLLVIDRASLHGSRSMFDQHRDMRLDVDNMSYEELLALGERIGTVSTGLSEELMSKCLVETVHCLTDKIHENGSCIICLEEYKNMDKVASLKTCGHDYHVSCIKKWLSMKNLCPICKTSALTDNV